MAHQTKMLVVVISLLIPISHLQAFSWSPFSLLDRNLAKHYGAQPVSAWYQEKTHEFLKNMGVKDAHHVPVRQIVFSKDVMQHVGMPFLDRMTNLTLATGIWLRESMLDKVTNETRLWVLAHEAAHYSLGHGIMTLIGPPVIRWVPAAIASAMTGASLLGFNWLSSKIGYLEKNRSSYQKIIFVFASLYFGSDIVLTAQHLNLVYFGAQKFMEKEADLAAVKMLCEHGYAYVVEHHLQATKDAVSRGIVMLNGHNHPSLQEQAAYLQEFWNIYLRQHPEYHQESVVEVFQQTTSEPA